MDFQVVHKLILSQFSQDPEAIDMLKFLGNVFIGMGIVMLFWGYSEYDSAGSKFKKAFSGSMTDKAIVLLIGGGACAAAGAFLSFRKR
jgi:hypothetical protein